MSRLLCMGVLLLLAAPAAAQEGEPVDYAMLSRNTLEGGLLFAGLDRFPDMALEPRLDAPGLAEPERAVIEDAAGWKAFWGRAAGDVSPLALTLPVDFDAHRVVVSAAGRRSDGGHATFVVDVVETASEIRVAVEETQGACPGDAQASSPLAVVRIPRSSKPVRFDVTPIPCPQGS